MKPIKRISPELRASFVVTARKLKAERPIKPSDQYGLYCDVWMHLVLLRAANKILAKHGFFKGPTVDWDSLGCDPDSIAATHLRPIFTGSLTPYSEPQRDTWAAA